MAEEKIKCLIQKYNQEHLLRFKESNTKEQNEQLLKDIENINFASLCLKENFSDSNGQASIDEFLEPLDSSIHQSIKRTSPEDIAKFRKLGLEAISNGKVAALLLAGGQGTRLGSKLPKGMFDIGLKSGRTLYQIQAERIYRLQELAKKTFGKSAIIPWYIMTSEHTKEITIKYFEKHNYFNLDKNNIIVFEQNSIPSFTFDGKIIMNQPYKIARSPDGNGGLYEALRKRKILDHMKERGIEHIQAYCVDNILVKVCDPTFIGYCISKNAECAAKVVEKINPDEAVGIICKVHGKFQVVEYSEVSRETSQKRNSNGDGLLFNAGNICNHYFTLDFLTNKVKEDELPYHIAKKKIPFVDQNGHLVEPTKPNGIKLEKFIFDVFQFVDCNKFAVWEVIREDEFSPLKNNDQCERDTPTTARLSLYNLHQRFILKAGGKFLDENGSPVPLLLSPAAMLPKTNGNNPMEKIKKGQIICEISPLVSYDGEDLETIVQGKTFRPPVLIEQKN